MTVILSLAACTHLDRSPGGASGDSQSLLPSDWVVEDVGGRGIIDSSHLTLTFDAQGQVSGSGGCNKFKGTARVAGDRLTFGALSATRMACGPALIHQEQSYLATLEAAERYSVDTTGALLIFSTGALGPSKLRLASEYSGRS